MEKHIINLLHNENQYNQILNDCRNALKYPLLNVKRDILPSNMSKFYGNWVKGWTNNSNWINYGLIYNKEIIPISLKRHPATFEFLKSFNKKIFMAGYSILKAKSGIPAHRDEHIPEEYITSNNVCHIGLFVPDKCFLKVNNEMYKHGNRKFLTFNDSYEHSAFNGSNQDRIILYIKFDEEK